MALNKLMLLELCKRLKSGSRIASMGYPDITVELSNLEEYIGAREVSFRSDSALICKRHGIPLRAIPDAASLFSAMGAKLDVFDIVQERGDEIVCDLNEPLNDYVSICGGPFRLLYQEQYDFVLDIGTIEHCFNIGQAVKNMAGLLQVGGIILHENPFLMGNHGFYSMNPTWYADFYESNGFKMLDCAITFKGEAIGRPKDFTSRFSLGKEIPGDALNVFAMAERVELKPFVWPTQTKYKKIYAAAELSGEKEKYGNVG